MKKIEKIAVCVGINKYPDPRNNLNGCVNDAKDIRSALINQFHFDKTILLLDHKATYRNVVTSIQDAMLDLCDYGHFVFSVSSHGTSVPDRSGDEPDGRDEAICLYDKLLVDDTFRTILDKAPVGMKATIITDCCHSGSITRSAYIRNFPSSVSRGLENLYMKPRYLPPVDDEFAVSVKTSNVRSKMFTSVQEQANMREVLITGCKSDEYSYDAFIDGKYHGAMTYNLLQIFNNMKGKNLTYNEMYTLLKDRLPSSKYPQSPQLEGTEKNKNTLLFS